MSVSCMLHIYIPKVQRSLYFQRNSCSTHAALKLLLNFTCTYVLKKCYGAFNTRTLYAAFCSVRTLSVVVKGLIIAQYEHFICIM